VNDAEAALRVVKHLHRLQGQWQHILQDSVYERLMGYLLEYVIRLVMKPVFEVFHRVSVPIFFSLSKLFITSNVHRQNTFQKLPQQTLLNCIKNYRNPTLCLRNPL
jgi:hypothetical protein